MKADAILPQGFRAAGVACGLKKTGALDLGLIVADGAFPAHAMFTRNQLLGAHIPVCHRHLERSRGRVRAVLVNSGNANCATGEQGEKDNEAVCRELAAILKCPPEQILFSSTGVIGARLDVGKVAAALPGLHDALCEDGLPAFAEAILTTDTVIKLAGGTIDTSEGETARVCGVAKGSGMIHPDMATMLGFLITDGRSTADLGLGMRRIADRSFHCVTVDGDTSPNDTFLLWTAERIWCRPVADADPNAVVYPLEQKLTEVGQDLARQIARDGEGASRLIALVIEGASSEADALDAGRFIARSPLVKTAVCGRDPNWGRILSSAATSGVPIQIASARVRIGEHLMFGEGEPQPQNEAAAARYLRDNEEVEIGVDLGMGPFSSTVWTCDFTAGYVEINAHYRS